MAESLLPQILRDRNNLALEKCIKQAVSIDINKIMVNPIENASEEVLSSLAKEYHVLGWEGWNFCKNLKEKQKLIINSLSKHSRKGSIPAIKEILNDFNIEAEVEEFWQYGGRPGHYILKFLNIYDRGLTEELKESISKIINSYAPKSRILDYINFFLCSKGTVYTSTHIKTTKKIVIKSEVVL